jgi:hypothetical protein
MYVQFSSGVDSIYVDALNWSREINPEADKR